MRILVISPGVLPLPPVLGGAVENLIARLHGKLSTRYEFHYVSVAVPLGHAPARDNMAGGHFHQIESINPLQDFHTGNQFELQESDKWPDYEDFCQSVARDVRPDIIHIHNEARLASALRRTVPAAKVVVHVNDEVVTRLSGPLLRDLKNSTSLILACSGYIRNQMKRAFQMGGVTEPDMEVFYNFVDCDEYDPARFRQKEVDDLRHELGLGRAPTLLFVGRLIEQKGPHLALRALRWMLKHDGDARILFVGAPWYSRETDSPWVDFLRKEGADISERLVFTGYIPHEKIPLYYRLGDIAVVPSIWDDPSPFVAYEAQAMQCPVLSSERGGIPEIVNDGETGRTIDVFNTPLFGQLLLQWLRDDSLRERMGIAGRNRVLNRFTLEHAAMQMAEVYERLRP